MLTLLPILHKIGLFKTFKHILPNEMDEKTFSEKPFIFGKCMFYDYLDVFILKG